MEKSIKQLKATPMEQMSPDELRKFAAFAAWKLGFKELAKLWEINPFTGGVDHGSFHSALIKRLVASSY